MVDMSSKLKFNTSNKGQAAGAAVLVAIIAGLLIMFIIMIPPSERAKILGEPVPGSSTNGVVPENSISTLLVQHPGRIDYLVQKEIEHPLPVINIQTTEEAGIISEKSVVSSKRGLFSEKSSEFSFSVSVPSDVHNPLLTFRVTEQIGDLHVIMNGEEIFSGPAGGSQMRPVIIPAGLLQSENTIVFKVSSPGLAFWRTNSFVAENVKVVADTVNREAQVARHVFLVSETEKQNLERVQLKFHPECRYGDAGLLHIYLNGKEVYSATPDCELSLVPIELSSADLMSGENRIEFRTDRGTYLLSSVNVISKLKEVTYPTYYFELSEEQYNAIKTHKNDLKISLAFTDVTDERSGQIIFNGVNREFNTRNPTLTLDVSADVEKGSNSVVIKPRRAIEVREVRADIVN